MHLQSQVVYKEIYKIVEHELHKHKRLRDLQYILNKGYKYIEIKCIFKEEQSPGSSWDSL